MTKTTSVKIPKIKISGEYKPTDQGMAAELKEFDADLNSLFTKYKPELLTGADITAHATLEQELMNELVLMKATQNPDILKKLLENKDQITGDFLNPRASAASSQDEQRYDQLTKSAWDNAKKTLDNDLKQKIDLKGNITPDQIPEIPVRGGFSQGLIDKLKASPSSSAASDTHLKYANLEAPAAKSYLIQKGNEWEQVDEAGKEAAKKALEVKRKQEEAQKQQEEAEKAKVEAEQEERRAKEQRKRQEQQELDALNRAYEEDQRISLLNLLRKSPPHGNAKIDDTAISAKNTQISISAAAHNSQSNSSVNNSSETKGFPKTEKEVDDKRKYYKKSHDDSASEDEIKKTGSVKIARHKDAGWEKGKGHRNQFVRIAFKIGEEHPDGDNLSATISVHDKFGNKVVFGNDPSQIIRIKYTLYKNEKTGKIESKQQLVVTKNGRDVPLDPERLTEEQRDVVLGMKITYKINDNLYEHSSNKSLEDLLKRGGLSEDKTTEQKALKARYHALEEITRGTHDMSNFGIVKMTDINNGAYKRKEDIRLHVASTVFGLEAEDGRDPYISLLTQYNASTKEAEVLRYNVEKYLKPNTAELKESHFTDMVKQNKKEYLEEIVAEGEGRIKLLGNGESRALLYGSYETDFAHFDETNKPIDSNRDEEKRALEKECAKWARFRDLPTTDFLADGKENKDQELNILMKKTAMKQLAETEGRMWEKGFVPPKPMQCSQRNTYFSHEENMEITQNFHAQALHFRNQVTVMALQKISHGSVGLANHMNYKGEQLSSSAKDILRYDNDNQHGDVEIDADRASAIDKARSNLLQNIEQENQLAQSNQQNLRIAFREIIKEATYIDAPKNDATERGLTEAKSTKLLEITANSTEPGVNLGKAAQDRIHASRKAFVMGQIATVPEDGIDLHISIQKDLASKSPEEARKDSVNFVAGQYKRLKDLYLDPELSDKDRTKQINRVKGTLDHDVSRYLDESAREYRDQVYGQALIEQGLDKDPIAAIIFKKELASTKNEDGSSKTLLNDRAFKADVAKLNPPFQDQIRDIKFKAFDELSEKSQNSFENRLPDQDRELFKKVRIESILNKSGLLISPTPIKIAYYNASSETVTAVAKYLEKQEKDHNNEAVLRAHNAISINASPQTKAALGIGNYAEIPSPNDNIAVTSEVTNATKNYLEYAAKKVQIKALKDLKASNKEDHKYDAMSDEKIELLKTQTKQKVVRPATVSQEMKDAINNNMTQIRESYKKEFDKQINKRDPLERVDIPTNNKNNVAKSKTLPESDEENIFDSIMLENPEEEEHQIKIHRDGESIEIFKENSPPSLDNEANSLINPTFNLRDEDGTIKIVNGSDNEANSSSSSKNAVKLDDIEIEMASLVDNIPASSRFSISSSSPSHNPSPSSASLTGEAQQNVGIGLPPIEEVDDDSINALSLTTISLRSNHVR